MRDKFKRPLYAVFALILSAFILTGCTASSSASDELSESDELAMGYLESYAREMVEMLASSDEETIGELAAAAEEFDQTALVNGYSTWLNTRDELGELKNIDAIAVEKTAKKEYRAVVDAEFADKACEISIGVNRITNIDGSTYFEINELSFSPEYSMGEIMAQAFGNMVVGMGTVFAVLIFIALIIGLFKYIPNPEEMAKRKAAEASKAAEQETSAEAEATAFEGIPEEELTAVIAAAIAAYESETKSPTAANGLIVRSIRRVPNSRKAR